MSMLCPHCGAEAVPGNTFCHRCRKRVIPPSYSSSPPAAPPRAPDPAPASEDVFVAADDEAFVSAEEPEPDREPVRFRRPWVVTFVAVLDFLGGAAYLLLAVLIAVMALALLSSSGPAAAVLLGVGVGVGLVAALLIMAGVGLLRLKRYGRILEIITILLNFAALLLVLVVSGGRPSDWDVAVVLVHAVTSLAVLVYFLQPGAKLIFSGRAAELDGSEWAEVERFSRTGALAISIVVGTTLSFVLAAAGAVGNLGQALSRGPRRGRQPMPLEWVAPAPIAWEYRGVPRV
jgi:hypothetical protein